MQIYSPTGSVEHFSALDPAVHPDAFSLWLDWLHIRSITSSENLRQKIGVLNVCTVSLSFHK